jgi:plastocyanin
MNRVGLLGVVLAAALLAPVSAAAAPVAISITGPSSPGYDPAVVGRSIGASFQWTNNDSFGLSHTVTQGDTPSATPGPSLFDSNAISSGSSFLQQLTAGGVYNYFCKFHPSTMHGKIKIRDKVSPTSGPPGTKFTITIATVDATGTRVYDVQKRINGGAWTTSACSDRERGETRRPASA